MTDDNDAEAVLDDIKNQRRTNTEVSTEESAEAESVTLSEAVADALMRIEEENINPTTGFRDEKLYALLDALEASGQLDELVSAARDHLGQEDDTQANRSEACRLLVRVGIQSIDESILDEARAGRKQYVQSKTESEPF